MNVYMLHLSSGGDTFIVTVDEETWKWVTTNDPGYPDDYHGESSWLDQLVPPSQLEKIKAIEDEPLVLTTGSWKNDRAVAACPADGYPDAESDMKDALAVVRQKGDTLIDVFHGGLY